MKAPGILKRYEAFQQQIAMTDDHERRLEVPFHPLIYFEIARQRQGDVLLRAERYRLAKEAEAGTDKHNDHGGLTEALALSKRRPSARPQRASS